MEQSLTSEHFVQHCAESPDVGALVHRFAARLFGAHIRRSAHDHPCLRQRHGQCGRVVGVGAPVHALAALHRGKSEVENFDHVAGRHQDVGGFQVPMYDALFVRSF